MNLKVQACIPHFFNENQKSNENYGSCRAGAQLARSLALAKCISSVIALRRGQTDFELNIGEKTIDELTPHKQTGQSQNGRIDIEITVCTTGNDYLQDVLSLYESKINILNFNLGNPRNLGLAARDHLIHNLPDADLFLYLEDDLVIRDTLYLDKLIWFHSRTQHQACLMPHRYELCLAPGRGRLYVDGPPSKKAIENFIKPKKDVAEGDFKGYHVSFDIAVNPHSGTFCLSLPQATRLRNKSLPKSGFAGPLETAATYTVMKYFPILKSSKRNINFFEIEHAHPSFLDHFRSFPVSRHGDFRRHNNSKT